MDVQQQLSALVYKELGNQTPAQYKARYEKLEARREELEAAISAKSAEFRTEIEPVESAAVQAKIPEDAALVEIVQYRPYNAKADKTDKPRYAAAILRNQGQPNWVDLGEAATINQSVSELRRALSSAPPDPNRGIDVEPADGKSVEELARKLDEQVMKPLRSHLGNARHLLVSPDGQLTLIPFEALRDDKGKYLVENYAFSYLTKSQVLSLWLVSDDGTKDLMVKYYQGLKAGKGRHQALRDAQLEFLSTKGYEHPYFWAAFVPSGNWAGL